MSGHAKVKNDRSKSNIFWAIQDKNISLCLQVNSFKRSGRSQCLDL